MPDPKASNMYRIGDYARYMGVSPDLLKHYEKLGLIHSETLENGYHYYAFQQSVPLLECMRLRNYGFSLREMADVMQRTPFDAVQSQLDRRIDEMEKRLRFEQLVIQEHRHISAWMDMMRPEETIIREEELEPLLFLPQSRQLDFIRDERISELLDAWVAAMPLVKSCRLLPNLLSPGVLQDAAWGLAVTESNARLLGLPVNDMVKHVPGGRCLFIHHRWAMSKYGWVRDQFETIRALLRERGIHSIGASVQVALMRVNMDHDRETCGWFAIPPAEAPEHR